MTPHGGMAISSHPPELQIWLRGREVLAWDRNITALNADGSRVTTVSERNADTTLRDGVLVAISDDGFVTTTQSDINGDGAWDFTTTDTTTFGIDGSVSEAVTHKVMSLSALKISTAQIPEMMF